MSVEKLITDHIDIWSSALQTRSTAGRGSNGKIDLYGIKKLRELILELAVRGKLVPQDQNDEPASDLLRSNEKRKQELAKDGSMKTAANGNVNVADYYLETPKNWSWIRLGNLARFIDYRGKTPKKTESGIRLITAKNIKKGFIDLNPEEFIAEQDYQSWMTRGFPKNGDILFTTEAPLGNAAVIDLNDKFALAQRSICFQWHIPEISPFMLIQILAKPFQSQLNDQSTGMTATGIKAAKLKEIPVILPPMLEQKKVVARVKELMSLCDQLEQQALTSLDAHQQLVETLLATLTGSQNAEELAENWARISLHFDTLFTTEASIDALKQAILQLAVMGKLVPQDPNDEPASELLKRIEQEKTQLVREGKIKKQKPLPPMSDEEKPFELPEGWEWATLSHLGSFAGGKTPSKMRGDYWEGDIPWVTPKDMKTPLITTSEDFVTDLAIEDGLSKFSPGSLLFVARSGILRRTFPVAITAIECTVNQDIKVLTPFVLNINSYIFLMMRGFETHILKNLTKVGTTVESLLFDEFASHPFMLPPLEEQLRITNRVNGMMKLCDTLKSRLQSAQQTQLHMADALTDAALN
ncbi:type I restriction endonuclease EcoAI subunit S [Serratia marcescens]|jgi:type I restriction enzyme S subunit|uniref:Restriction endonuclease subunit S n=1 Tax=Serratia marcescens TaxID=615 RepID=A0A5C7CIU2_SERMA|nr:restriction endonuclease subunit S [Serratia marcescens]MBH3013066.1 restriction endonuclease subunit S [Serratia marcescens]TXE36202.1 restriction endonuclease subunit S [Serratia marcescens]TXE60609.1 restriction endonuclease subunit S [Serratia marcescens]BEM53007.1 type I restriction endonuclease EcoAI subunit S [Serratia marcescens]BEO18264.1 type I restriction endonuclease EcoAI subunit S [Serratia marcescens]